MRRWRAAVKIARSTGNSKARSASSPSMTARQPVSSHSCPKASGAPIRRVSTRGPASALPGAESTITRSQKRAPEASRGATPPVSASSSARPTVATTCWRTVPPSRRFSTICR